MPADPVEGAWVDRLEIVSITELVSLSGLTEADVRELVDYGVLAPADPAQWTFSVECVTQLRRASRLKADLDLDTQALALALQLFERIGELESELARLRARR